MLHLTRKDVTKTRGVTMKESLEQAKTKHESEKGIQIWMPSWGIKRLAAASTITAASEILYSN